MSRENNNEKQSVAQNRLPDNYGNRSLGFFGPQPATQRQSAGEFNKGKFVIGCFNDGGMNSRHATEAADTSTSRVSLGHCAE